MTQSGDNEAYGFLGDNATVEVRRLIATGDLAPGERIVERDIATRLGVSRGPIRDAIKTLQHEGLVEVRPFAGACVATIDRDEIDEIVALRRQVEYFSIAGATLRATEDEIANLRAIANKMGTVFAAGHAEELLDLDLGFHLCICDASHHGTLSTAMRMLYPRLAVLFYPQMLESHTAETFEQAHHDLVDAIENGDIDASLAAIDDHIDSFYTDIELRVDDGRRRRRAVYLTKVKPARPVAVRRRRGTLD